MFLKVKLDERKKFCLLTYIDSSLECFEDGQTGDLLSYSFFSGQMSNETFKYTKEHRAQIISIKITCVSTAEIKEHVKILP